MISLVTRSVQRFIRMLNPNPPKDADRPQGDAEERYRRASEAALATIGLLIFLGIVALGIGAFATGNPASVLAVSAVLAGAASMVGALLGFLFGIPRTLQADVVEVRGGEGDGEHAQSTNQNRNVGYRANTNLEQISDWLTKILVGVGLTQLSDLPDALQSISETISPAFGRMPGATLLAGSTIVYFSICGFLICYLWTRLHLPSALRYADLGALGELEGKLSQLETQLEGKLSQLETQVKLDTLALNHVENQLNPTGADTPEITQEKLNEVVKAASDLVKARIFHRANSVRHDSWKTEKARVERTIPIFRALIAADVKKQFHRNFGQLGYALKDQREPDYLAAIEMLSKAIEIRGKGDEHRHRLYEANRAYCRIKLEERAGRKVVPPEMRELICSDLKTASQSENGREMVADAEIVAWMKANNCEA